MSGTPSISIDKQALQQTLLNETVKLFSLMAMADGQVSEEEEAYIHQYFQSLYPKDLANLLVSEFSAHVRQNLDQAGLLKSLEERLAYEEKIFLLTKLYELMAADEIDEQEMALLHQIGIGMGVEEGDLQTLNRLMRPDMAREEIESEDHTATIRCMTISDHPDSPVQLPMPGLDLLFMRVNRR